MVAERKIITSDDILGKDAVDPDGQILGVITKLHIEKDSKKMVGITIDEGFMKPNLFVGLDYIKNFGVDSVFLSKIPTEKYIGLKVFDSKGKLIGHVKKVVSKRHKVTAIEISKDKRVSASDIQEIGINVILKEKYKIEEKTSK